MHLLTQSVVTFYDTRHNLQPSSYILPFMLQMVVVYGKYYLIIEEYEYTTKNVESNLHLYSDDDFLLGVNSLLAFIDFICDEDLYEDQPFLSMKDPVFKMRKSADIFRNILRRFLTTR